jgi:DNA-binding NarL/FixJ family response regulator
VDARTPLRAAHEILSDMSVSAFAEQARRELAATGETRAQTTRRHGHRTHRTRGAHRPARAEGKTNPEIAAQLYVSPRTVERHMSKIFTKFGVSSRRKLEQALRSCRF